MQHYTQHSQFWYIVLYCTSSNTRSGTTGSIFPSPELPFLQGERRDYDYGKDQRNDAPSPHRSSNMSITTRRILTAEPLIPLQGSIKKSLYISYCTHGRAPYEPQRISSSPTSSFIGDHFNSKHQPVTGLPKPVANLQSAPTSSRCTSYRLLPKQKDDPSQSSP